MLNALTLVLGGHQGGQLLVLVAECHQVLTHMVDQDFEESLKITTIHFHWAELSIRESNVQEHRGQSLEVSQ